MTDKYIILAERIYKKWSNGRFVTISELGRILSSIHGADVNFWTTVVDSMPSELRTKDARAIHRIIIAYGKKMWATYKKENNIQVFW